jgi:hypothetical protein
MISLHMLWESQRQEHKTHLYLSITSDEKSEACIWTLPQRELYRSRHAALASLSDVSGASDKRPDALQHAGQGAFSTKSVLASAWTRYAQNLATQLERYRVGKPSLFSVREVPKPAQ